MMDGLDELSVRELLEAQVDYVIPMYQRNYAWGEGEITQLILDVLDSMPSHGATARHYYIGTLVVFKRQGDDRMEYEVIDGQQRLTTLSLLASYLRREYPEVADWFTRLGVRFQGREKSARTIAAIFDGTFKRDALELLKENEINGAVLNGYRHIQEKFPQLVTDALAFSRHLFEQVRIMRVAVPEDTELNHYFEIMNSRGEQLEKHEVLKSLMLSRLKCTRSENCFRQIWSACADMEKYVQTAFGSTLRSRLFGEKDWGSFSLTSFDEVCDILGDETQDPEAQSLEQILIDGAPKDKNQQREGVPERFNSVIDFPNFLLHVLAMDGPVALDDKGLLAVFTSCVLTSSDKVKAFGFNLLKCKFLLDQYVIKRELSKGHWTLSRYQWQERSGSVSGQGNYANTYSSVEMNRRMLMLLSAFHVSTSTMTYKYWLNAALHYLFHAKTPDVQPYLHRMESVAKAFVFDRFLAEGDGAKYEDIIYVRDGEYRACRDSITDQMLDQRLRYGGIRHNLVFNYLDYLLWMRYREEAMVDGYYFTFRSSVEHFYPQNPMEGVDPLDEEDLHSFGNLCLISHSKNSTLSNLTPAGKKDYYIKSIDSIKQHLMVRHEGEWNKNSIRAHHRQMKQVLLESL